MSKWLYNLICSLPYLVHAQAKTVHSIGDHYSERCMSAEKHLLAGCWCKYHRYVVEMSGFDTASMQCRAATGISSNFSRHSFGSLVCFAFIISCSKMPLYRVHQMLKFSQLLLAYLSSMVTRSAASCSQLMYSVKQCIHRRARP